MKPYKEIIGNLPKMVLVVEGRACMLDRASDGSSSDLRLLGSWKNATALVLLGA